MRDRLRSVDAYTFYKVDYEAKYTTFARMYFTLLYGGSSVSTFPKISEERVNVHGVDNLCFPNREYNPNAPVVPGDPGLFFTSRPNAFGSKSWTSRVFIPWKTEDSSQPWGYMGDYEFIPAQPLTAVDFISQTDAVSLESLDYIFIYFIHPRFERTGYETF